MACPRSNDLSPIVEKRFRTVKGFYPAIAPVISSLSTYSSPFNAYTRIFINGLNFFPFGSTTVRFGPITNIPVSYVSSFNISFTLPITYAHDLIAGTYDVQVCTLYNKPQLVQVAVYSNIVEYVIT
jgi:hypothetical protein